MFKWLGILFTCSFVLPFTFASASEPKEMIELIKVVMKPEQPVEKFISGELSKTTAFNDILPSMTEKLCYWYYGISSDASRCEKLVFQNKTLSFEFQIKFQNGAMVSLGTGEIVVGIISEQEAEIEDLKTALTKKLKDIQVLDTHFLINSHIGFDEGPKIFGFTRMPKRMLEILAALPLHLRAQVATSQRYTAIWSTGAGDEAAVTEPVRGLYEQTMPRLRDQQEVLLTSTISGARVRKVKGLEAITGGYTQSEIDEMTENVYTRMLRSLAGFPQGGRTGDDLFEIPKILSEIATGLRIQYAVNPQSSDKSDGQSTTRIFAITTKLVGMMNLLIKASDPKNGMRQLHVNMGVVRPRNGSAEVSLMFHDALREVAADFEALNKLNSEDFRFSHRFYGCEAFLTAREIAARAKTN